MGNAKHDEIHLEPNCFIRLFDEHGALKHYEAIHNTVTTGGNNGVAAQLVAAPPLPAFLAMAVGTGSPAANALGAEIARVAFTSRTVSSAVVTVVGTFGAGTGTGALTEAGTFDNTTATSGNMWMSASFSVVNKGALDTLTITWTLTV